MQHPSFNFEEIIHSIFSQYVNLLESEKKIKLDLRKNALNVNLKNLVFFFSKMTTSMTVL